MNIPVIAIDGPSASGKGTVAQRVAQHLGFHYLDSGALYRIVALAGLQHGIAWQDGKALASLVPQLQVSFDGEQIMLNAQEVSAQVRSEQMSQGASQVAVHPEVRGALVSWQHSLRQTPGLVADGRDMGTVIFPDAICKVFLTASAEVRADRRFRQLTQRGVAADYQAILQDLQARDMRDQARSASPLVQAQDAHLLDTDQMGIEAAVQQVLDWYQQSLAKQ
jgi:cytidylate kinase